MKVGTASNPSCHNDFSFHRRAFDPTDPATGYGAPSSLFGIKSRGAPVQFRDGLAELRLKVLVIQNYSRSITINDNPL